ncbi:hypothetical protein [Maridesulfovibrio sp.]|uniref:hypothetical protein n=1 Tax=Maridesulfovibrio sp. TaxID=2795000 RepID=UPI0029C9EE36|nr:hypothetical protein [Maridesulfovibrio sp.]
MIKIYLILALLTTLILCGCVARKTVGRHGFYSSKSPSLTINFNNLEYMGESKETEGTANVRTYFYSDGKGDEGAFVEIINLRQDWKLRPRKVPGEELPNTGIYTREIAGERFYCRTFLIPPESGKSGLASLPVYTAVRVCCKLISPAQKISIGYAGRVDLAQAERLFTSQNYGELTQKQKDFFAAFEERADKALDMKTYRKGDVSEKVETTKTLENPWYKFTDFLPFKSQIGKLPR